MMTLITHFLWNAFVVETPMRCGPTMSTPARGEHSYGTRSRRLR